MKCLIAGDQRSQTEPNPQSAAEELSVPARVYPYRAGIIGGAWGGDDVVTVTVNATGLLTGTYHGTVKVHEVANPTDQVTADVVLIVEPAPPVLDKRVWLPMIMR